MKNTKNKLKCSVAFVMALAGFIPTQSVFAIEEGSELALEEIIVTAQKRSERLQDVALSISAFSEKNIQDANITQIKDLSMLTPGLEFSETIGRQTTAPSIRGVAPLGFADPTVLVYVDGFTLGFTRSENNAQLFDLERIEVLKGPQATLYGRNALGGVVNYITKKPGNEFEGSVKGEYGRFNNFEIAGTAGGAVIEDKVFLQAGIGYRESGGFLDNEFDGANDVNDESDFNARVNMRFTPSDQLEVNLTVNYSKVDDACGDCAHVPVEWTGSRLDVGAGLVDFNNISNTVNMDRLGSYENEVFSFVSKVEYDMDWATLTNIAGFAKGEQMLVADFTRSPGPFGPFEGFTIRRDNKGWSEELRLASNGDEKLTWLVGFYAFKNNRTGQVFLDFDGGGDTLFTDSDIEVQNYAGFINLDYNLTETISIGGGLRYDYEKLIGEDLLGGGTLEKSQGEWLPKVTVSYRPNDDVHVYGTISKGYHAGGFNGALPIDDELAEYDAEYLWNYEIGIKGRLLDGRLQYDIAGYYLDWNDQQVQSQNGLGTIIFNGGEARIIGVDGSLTALLAEGLVLTSGFSAQNAKYTSYIDDVNAPAFGIDTNLAGNKLIGAPKLSLSSSLQYVFSLGNGDFGVRLRADGRYTSKRAFDTTNLLIAGSYFLANLYAGIENETIEVGIYVDNVFDKTYLLGGSLSSATFPPLLTISDPRIYGVRAKFKF